MYQVLYRKWRPQVFSDVVGQEHITRTLMSAVKQNRVSHAYLFTGSRGTGKTSCAKILAKAVNCEHPVDGNPCNECASCKGIDSGSVVDVVEIDAASNNGVDNIRDLREETNYMPSQVKYRVFIIDEVHMLSTGAFNALLKTLEEPPEHVKFILATTEVHKLPATILSRCQRFDFKRIAPEHICSRLQYVSEQEGISLTDSAAFLIARISDGGMRDALSLLDRCSSFSKEIDEELVLRASGIAGKEHIFRLTDAVCKGDSKSALEIIDELYKSSCDMERLMISLTEHLRNLMICLTVDDPSRLIVASEAELEKTRQQAESLTLETVMSCMETANEAVAEMKKGAGKRIAAEMAVIKLSTPSLSGDNASILRRLSALENGAVLHTPAPKAEAPVQTVREEAKPVEPKPSVKAEPAEKTEAVPTKDTEEQKTVPETAEKSEAEVNSEISPAPAAQGAFGKWNQVRKLIAERDPMVSSFIGRSVAAVKGNVLYIKDANPLLADFIKKRENYEVIEKAVLEVSGAKYKIAIFGAEESEKPSAEVRNEPSASGIEAILQKAKELDIPIIEQ